MTISILISVLVAYKLDLFKYGDDIAKKNSPDFYTIQKDEKVIL